MAGFNLCFNVDTIVLPRLEPWFCSFSPASDEYTRQESVCSSIFLGVPVDELSEAFFNGELRPEA
jgi:hypothetical protein